MPMTRLFVGLFALLVAVGCAEGQRPASETAAEPSAESTSSAESQGRLPQHLVGILRGNGVSVEHAEFNGGLSVDATLRRFEKQYDGSHYSRSPEVYALNVTASPSPGMPPGSSVRMVYLPDVQDAFEGVVAPEPGSSEPPAESPSAHMFAFFDGETGRHLETTYIAMDE